MQKRTRRILFYALLLLFIIATPVLLLMSFGYSFDASHSALEQKGGIFVKSSGTRVNVFVNGTLIKQTSLISGGALITDIEPGTHLVRVEKEGYIPWTKPAIVEPIRVTELRSILLLPDPVQIATSTESELSLFSTSSAPARFFEPAREPIYTYSLTEQRTLEVTLATTTRELPISNIHSFFALSKNIILFIDMNGFLARHRILEGETTAIGRPGFFLENGTVSFIPGPAGDVALLDPSGGLYIIDSDDAITPIDGGVNNVRFDSVGGKLLIIKEREIDYLWLRDHRYQPFQERWTKDRILSLGSAVLDASWLYYDGAHVIFQTEEGIYLTETDNRGGVNTAELVSGHTDEIRTSPELPRSIFYRRENIWHTISI